MNRRLARLLRFSTAAAILAGLLILTPSAQLQGKEFHGKWFLTLTMREGPKIKTKKTLGLMLEVSPRGNKPMGELTITDDLDRTVPGVWRQKKKEVSIVYELPCDEDEFCASLIILGKVKGNNTKFKKGKVIIMWDEPNDKNPALYRTNLGSAAGNRLE